GAGATVERPLTAPAHGWALERLQNLLTGGDEATLSLPPGAMGELLALRIIQRLGGRRVVVVLLSSFEQMIHLIRQWRQNMGWGDLAALQVAEESGTQAANPLEIDFPLTQHPDTIRRFLAWHHTGIRVILATRAMLPLLSRAMMGFAQADCLIGFGASGDPLPAAKRVTLLPASSRNPTTPSPERSLTLPLPRPWRLLLLPTEVGKGTTDLLASLLAQMDTLEELRHVHVHLPDSASLPLLEPGMAETLRCQLFHLPAGAKSTEQERILIDFQRARRAVLFLNAMPTGHCCLPEADLVLFLAIPRGDGLPQALDPLLSVANPGGVGLVALPLFLKEGALGENERLWELLNGLRRIDPTLHAQIRTAMEQSGREGTFAPEPLLARFDPVNPAGVPALQIVAELLKNLGDPWDQRFGEFQTFRQLHGHGVVPVSWPESPELAEWASRQRHAWSRGTLEPEQQARLEASGFVRDPEAHAWEQDFARLERFIQRHGHARIGDPCPEDPALLEWTLKQRHLKKKGKLSFDRESRLEGVRFIWDPEEAAWEDAFQLFLRFRGLRGHGKIPSHFPEDPLLGKWAEKQRKEKEQKKLPPARQARLEAEGFVWDLAAAAWDEMLEVLRRHRAEHGHGKVLKEWPENPTLAIWAEEQRRLREKGQLSPERIARLEAVDFVWDLKRARWEEGWQAFLQFSARAGHGKVPDPCLDSMLLDQWAREMRRAWRLGQIDPKLQSRLEEAGFVWDLEQAAWEERFAELQLFQERHGHAGVIEPCPEHPLLPAWVQAQRRAWAKGGLSDAMQARLDGAGFIRDPAEKLWNDLFAALQNFYETQGHFNVPREWPDSPELFAWVKAQRLAREKEKLDPAKLARLAGLGFIWDPREAAWEELFLALTRFQQARNHCLVPAQWEHDPGLARWVDQQRRDYRLKLLKPDQIQRLESLGFIWDSKAIFWEEMFAALTEYRERHGDCLVTESSAELSQLAWWVAAQRKARLAGQLEPERIQRLDAIGFVWDAQEVLWLESFRGLEEFQKRFGHVLVPADWPEDPRLAAWVIAQRNIRLKGNMGEKHAALLEALGMIWDPKEAVAEEMMLQLQQFKSRHGHCEVPLETPEHPRLGLWLQFQRQAKRDGLLDPQRLQRLEQIGVAWKQV
ncbi:MAG: helicase associated domain-containing protein, partial [Magnetococcales bacterium]|nr:helicase associated domain-containing protein [Magnetococcales bacterium]